MDQFISSLPKSVLAIGAIIIGFVLIISFNPPATVCDAQMAIFQESQHSFLYLQSSARPAASKEMFERCQSSNSPGGCFELFNGLKKLSRDLDNIPHQCSETAASDAVVKSAILKNLELMAQIAWGEKAPISFTDKQSWFDSSDVALFCSLEHNASRILGDEAVYEWRRGVIHSLPQADRMETDDSWRKSLFSTSCESYR